MHARKAAAVRVERCLSSRAGKWPADATPGNVIMKSLGCITVGTAGGAGPCLEREDGRGGPRRRRCWHYPTGECFSLPQSVCADPVLILWIHFAIPKYQGEKLGRALLSAGSPAVLEEIFDLLL